MSLKNLGQITLSLLGTYITALLHLPTKPTHPLEACIHFSWLPSLTSQQIIPKIRYQHPNTCMFLPHTRHPNPFLDSSTTSSFLMQTSTHSHTPHNDSKSKGRGLIMPLMFSRFLFLPLSSCEWLVSLNSQQPLSAVALRWAQHKPQEWQQSSAELCHPEI